MIMTMTEMTIITILKTIMTMEMSSVGFLGIGDDHDHDGDGDAGDDGKGDYLEDNDKDEDAFSWFFGA